MASNLKIMDMAKTFGSKTKAQEMLLLLKDAKEVVRHGYYEHELLEVRKFCAENNLSMVKSRFKVMLADKESGFSNKGVRIDENDPRRGMYFVYISKDCLKAHKASYYEIAGNDAELGLLLGYPVCCVKFFCENFSSANPNPEIRQCGSRLTDISHRKDDCVLISHFPCSADCAKSTEMARRNLEIVSESDHERSYEIAKTLNL